MEGLRSRIHHLRMAHAGRVESHLLEIIHELFRTVIIEKVTDVHPSRIDVGANVHFLDGGKFFLFLDLAPLQKSPVTQI